MVGADIHVRAVRSVAWYSASRALTQLVSWAVTIVLAAWLSPADYGLFAMALAVIAFLELFQELGMGTVIVQRRDLSRAQVDALFWIVALASIALVLVVSAGAGLIARFYAEPRLVWIIRILSLTFLLNSLGMVPESLLTRDIDFRRRSIAETAGVIVSAVVAVVFAYLDFAIWALLLGHLARAAVRNGVMAYLCAWVPRLPTARAGIREVFQFGMRVTGARLITTASLAANTAIVGRLMGGFNLGLYTMADALASGPHRLLTSVINQVALPVFARLQDDRAQLARYLVKITTYVAVVSLPAQIGMALVGDDVVTVLLQEKWRPMVHLFQLFCVGNVTYVLSLTATSLLYARGRADLVLRFVWLSALGTAAALAVGARYGLPGLGIAWVGAFVPLRLYVLWLGLAEARVPIRTFLGALRCPAIATAVMALAVWGAQTAYHDHAGTLARLVLGVATGMVSYAVTILAVDPGLGVELRRVLRSLLHPAAPEPAAAPSAPALVNPRGR
jgi:O-antigen/teichoic acid export membrane protein